MNRRDASPQSNTLVCGLERPWVRRLVVLDLLGNNACSTHGAGWMRGAEAAAAELTIDDGGKRKEGIKGERDGGTEGRQHFVALKTTLNASLL